MNSTRLIRTLCRIFDAIRQFLKRSKATNGALECYQAVLQSDAGNTRALAGITAVENKYIAWARRELARHNIARAETYLRRLKTLNEQREEVAELERQLAQAKQAARAAKAIAKLTPKCAPPTQWGAPSCWMKVANQQRCYLWNKSPQSNGSVTWSGPCQNHKPIGRGTVVWSNDISGQVLSAGTGYYIDGKKHGQWTKRWPSGVVGKLQYVHGVRQ